MADWGFETRQVHAGAEPDPTTGARAVPIYQTTSFVFRDTEHAANLFGLAELGNIYTRIMNPTQAVFEERVAALEGGIGALATASGQAAQIIALLNLAENGGHIVSSSSLYGGTYNQLHYTFPKLGIEVSFIDDPDDLDAWKAAIRPNTKAFYGETHRQPEGRHPRLRGHRRRSRTRNGIPLVVDNTLASPYLCQPLSHGADIVTHSATKFIGGHGTSIGGIIVDGGKFDYEGSGRFPNFTEPEPSYHGLAFSELPDAALAGAVHPQGPAHVPARHRRRDLAVQRVPDDPGTRDAEPADGAALPERARGRAVARGARRGGVGRLPGPARRASGTTKRSSTCRTAKVRSCRSGSRAASRPAERFIDGLELFSHLANVGDVRSLAIHPASTTHQQLTPEEQATAGVTPDSFACRWASSRSTTSSPTSTPGSAPPRGRDPTPWIRGPRPVTGAWRPGDPPGGASSPRSSTRARTSSRAADGSPTRDRRVRDVGRANDADAPNARAACSTRSPATVTPPARPARVTVDRAGGTPSSDPAAPIDTDRSSSCVPTCSAGARARPGPRPVDPATGAPYGSRFPIITIRDQVVVEAALADPLGIDRWAAVVGGSMGGQRALEWAVSFPDRVPPR